LLSAVDRIPEGMGILPWVFGFLERDVLMTVKEQY
jgi:hypothetical protein